MAGRDTLVTQVRVRIGDAHEAIRTILQATSNPTITAAKLDAAEELVTLAIRDAVRIVKKVKSEDGRD